MREISIIGYGRFGQLAAFYLKQQAIIFVFDKKPITIKHRGVIRVSLKEAASKSHVILSVPINQLEGTIKNMSPYLRPGTVVYDVCSVKEQPGKLMRKYLPSSVSIIGTHPLFGPDSAGRTLQGRQIAICPVRASQAQIKRTGAFLRSLHLDTTIMEPDEHDKLMASTLFLAQFICRGLSKSAISDTSFATQNYIILKQIIDITNNDSIELFRDMYKYNRFARNVPAELLRNLKKLAGSLPK